MIAGGIDGRAAADPAVSAARRQRVARCARRRRSSTRRSRAIVLLGLEAYRAFGGDIRGPQLFQTALICLGYFATVGIAVAIGRYTTASEELAAQRGIDVANLEQVNRLIIQDMQDGVLVVDLNGVVRGHNAQVTRLLGGFGRMRGGMRLAEFSDDAARLLAALAGGLRRSRCRRSRSKPRSDCLRVRLVRIGSGLNGGTLIYLGRPRTRPERGAADEARRDGAADGVDRARSAQPAVGDQPGVRSCSRKTAASSPKARGCSA